MILEIIQEQLTQLIQERLTRSLVLFVLLIIIFWVLEGLWPSIRGQSKLRKGVGLDTAYWFFTPAVSQILSMIVVAILLVPLFWLLGRSLDTRILESSTGPLAQIHPWIQGLIIIFIGDFMGYWTHRWFHSAQLWEYHAVHHSSDTLDWLSAVRLHPVNDIISRITQSLPVVLLGFSPLMVELYVPFLSFYIALIHANVSWSYGPLRYVFASPVFHRWHHTKDEEGQGRNFAGLFPIFDLMFGTFYMPPGRQPGNFGIEGETMSENFWDQLIYPFAKKFSWNSRKRRLS